MYILPLGTSREKVESMCVFMSNMGLVFKSTHLDDSTPYCVLMGGSSVQYRTRSKWGEDGIVLFCTDVDYLNLKNINGVKCYLNNDGARPHAVFVPDVKFEEAVIHLKKNRKNTMLIQFVNSGRRYTKKSYSSSRRRKGKGLFYYFFRHFKKLIAFLNSPTMRKPLVGSRSGRRQRW